MSESTLWLVIFLVLAVGGWVGMFLFGWMRRKEKPPPGVKPLPRDDDW
jgi:hypothetical protein